MGRIRVLPGSVANQIAAGEVVERPASVVKELIENALDAGAARLAIEIEGGGAERVRVADDGCGMEREDAILALERHATSKIREASDLQRVATLGFRGEALPSIASVSRMTLTTSAGAGPGGTRIRVAAGVIGPPEPAAHPRGTTVEVESLFYNAPARRKFLRAPAGEAARITDLVACVAAAHPAVAFTLQSGGRTLLSWGAAPGARERIAQILGPEEAARLVAAGGESGGLRLAGLVSAPGLDRSTSRHELLYVNGRPIRDRRILHAVQEAYATLLPRGRYPIVYLFLEVPADEVDVNVHPAKSEVRFRRPGAVHDLVRACLLRALRPPAPGLAGRVAVVSEAGPASWAAAAPAGGAPEPDPAPVATGWLETVPLLPLAQFRETYILAAAPDGLLIFDQHAAHERVLYERFMDESLSPRIARQRLLFPVAVEVSAPQMQAFESDPDLFPALGFAIEPFGTSTLRLEEAPALLSAEGLDRLIREMLDEILEWNRAEGIEALRHRLVATAACHAAVTARQRLEEPEMRRILSDLAASRSPMTCPHGRPTRLRLGLDAIEKEFRRR